MPLAEEVADPYLAQVSVLPHGLAIFVAKAGDPERRLGAPAPPGGLR